MRLGLGLGLGLGGLGLSGMGGVPTLASYAVGGVLPSAVMDFEAGFLSNPLSLARASTATYVDADGTVKTAAVDAPRFDWSTGRRALLIEGKTTNFATRSSHTAAYPWVTEKTLNGITSKLVASGTISGVPYADYALTGTATSSWVDMFAIASYSLTAAAAGQVWAASVYHQLQSGSWPSGTKISMNINEQASGSFLTGSNSGKAPMAAVGRSTHLRTLTHASTNQVVAQISISDMTDGVTTFTGQVIRLFGWQLEQGAAPTSLMQTLGGVTVLRKADSAKITALAAGTYDRRMVTSAGTVDTKGIVHPGGDIVLPAGAYYRLIYYPGGTL